ncbi:MAG: DUF4386 domain-containing protein [Anaerolineales bacterium]
MNPLNKTSKLAGVLYLIITFIAPFSMLYVPSKLIVAGDALTTASNIQSAQGLFRAAIASDALVFLLEIALTVLVYQLVKPVDKTLALISAYARLGMTVIQGVNVINYLFVLLLVNGAGYLSALANGQSQSLVSLFLHAHDSASLIWGLFFGVHLLMLGYLVYKSGYMPKWLGVVLLITSLLYLAQGFGIILFPQFEASIKSMMSLAFIEIAFPLWLLVKGVKDQPA